MMQQSLPEPLEAVLLTGAGFTKNFGGFLSDDMRAFIVSRIQDRPVLMGLLNDRMFDYESVYVEVMYGNYSQNDKLALADAVFYAYEKLDDVVRNISWTPSATHGLNLYALKKLLNRFGSTVNGKRGYFFTLNQDLFVERWHSQETLLKIPGSLNLPDIHHQPSRRLEW